MIKDASTRESKKRSLFKIPFKLMDGLEIGVNGYALVVEEKRRAYTWVDQHSSIIQEVKPIIEYIDSQSTAIVQPKDIVNYFPIGDPKESKKLRKIIFNKDELEKIRNAESNIGITLLRFRPKDELKWKYHIKHSYFIFPNEELFTGSIRTFTALVKSMYKKDKIGYGIFRSRKNGTPSLVAMLPQLELYDEETHSQIQPTGIHLCILPWADEIRPLVIPPPLDILIGDETEEESLAINAARKMAKKMKLTYAPDNIRNPGLNYHYDYLAAKCCNLPFEKDIDQSLPWYNTIEKRSGTYISQLNEQINEDPRVDEVTTTSSGTKKDSSKRRRMTEDGEGVDLELIISAFESRKEKTLVVQQLKDFLIHKKVIKSTGKAPLKPELIEKVKQVLIEENLINLNDNDVDHKEKIKKKIRTI
ncbi:hypothetical protein CROQUDRAFT_661353 [Cronartium quercuum f. sp. fusiforme G11]|uniref:DNA helicase n=1 Tax=Cronartium quercuum f. sp. fusiforme G11 TaxID=708437 RepID=A0A9P6NFQ0_9BASI|nr:hypothetical protein CROQUDRAFT_661353 [Cronartium quercuum f. sp. fusiforme G11]